MTVLSSFRFLIHLHFLQKGHGIVFADFDEDGDQDIYSALGGYWPGDVWPNQFFLNETATDNRWVKIGLQGCPSHHYGVGAKIKVVSVDHQEAITTQHYSMDNKTGFGSAPYLADMGLGLAEAITYVEATWHGGERHGVVVRYPAELNASTILVETGGTAKDRQTARRQCVAARES